MKTFFTILMAAILADISYGQKTHFDSTFVIDNVPFTVAIEQDQQLSDPKNSSLTIYRNDEKILSDSIFTTLIEVDLMDLNLDGFPDLKVFQSTGARANETYNLYLYNEHVLGFNKVAGFDDWPNIDTTSIPGVLSAIILMGCVNYHFLELTNDAVLIDLEIDEADCELDGGGYNQGLAKVKKLKD